MRTETRRPDELDPGEWSRVTGAELEDVCCDVSDHMRKSSEGRPWRGLRVWHQVGPAGDLYIPPPLSHTILIRRSKPTLLLQRQGERVHHGAWQPGDAIVVPRGVPSFWRSDCERDNIHINLDPTWIEQAAGNDRVQLNSAFGRADPVLTHLAEVLLASLDSSVSLKPGFADAMAQSLSLHLVEHYAEQHPAGAARGCLTRRQLDETIGRVRGDLHSPWPISRMADAAGLSPFYFARAFKAAMGTTPHAFVTSLRMEKALELVRTTSTPFIDIGFDVGYGSAAHFAQAFKRHWGMTPGAARRAERLRCCS